jgi:HK97 family phage major capsid protein
VINRDNVETLIPEEYSRGILQEIPQNSALMSLGRRLPDMTRAQTRMSVLSGLPSAYFVNGDTGLKQTTGAEWENVYINAEEIACIVPIAEAVLADADYDIFEQLRPLIAEEFGRVIDLASLYGTGAPAAWPDGIAVQAAATTGHMIDLSAVIAGGGDVYDALLGTDGVWAAVEEDGYAVTGVASLLKMRAYLRSLRDTNGNPIFKSTNGEGGVQGGTRYEVDGVPIYFQRNIAEAEAGENLLIAGDFSRAVFAIRQDLTFKVLREAVIQDAAGNIRYNLAQQDMVALRCVMRLGWALPNPASRVQPTASERLPFAVLKA